MSEQPRQGQPLDGERALLNELLALVPKAYADKHDELAGRMLVLARKHATEAYGFHPHVAAELENIYYRAALLTRYPERATTGQRDEILERIDRLLPLINANLVNGLDRKGSSYLLVEVTIDNGVVSAVETPMDCRTPIVVRVHSFDDDDDEPLHVSDHYRELDLIAMRSYERAERLYPRDRDDGATGTGGTPAPTERPPAAGTGPSDDGGGHRG